MTYPLDFSLSQEVLEEIATLGLDYLPELIRLVLNTAMKAERQQYLGVAPYERSVERCDQGNGFKSKTLHTRLGEVVYLFLDARYEKVRQEGHVVDLAGLLAQANEPDGKRQLLGILLGQGEAETYWRTFMQSLVQRGLAGVRLIISDDHAGLKQARKTIFGGIPWQRCQFHLQQNAGAYVPRQEMRTEVAADIRKVFNAPDRMTAETYLKQIVRKYAPIAARLADWLEHNLPEGLTVFDFPEAHRRKLRTNNSLERLNREIGRRTDVVGIFPNEPACVRLVSALLMEQDEAWQTGRIYLTMENV